MKDVVKQLNGCWVMRSAGGGRDRGGDRGHGGGRGGRGDGVRRVGGLNLEIWKQNYPERYTNRINPHV